jgi:diguanylate cyclase (GGDEF)-like protein/PAS domain S-box-containing protein
LHSIGEAVIATNPEGQIILMNRMAENLTGFSWETARNQQLSVVFNPVAVPENASLRSHEMSKHRPLSETDGSLLLISRNGSQYFISVNHSNIEDNLNNFYGEVTVFRDVTQTKQENDEIRYVSYHDKLTGLYNRAFFEEEMQRLNTRRQYPITIILGDCNGLKIANDIFGHLEGDKLLQAIANIIKSAIRHEDIAARWGGDEFAIILPQTDEIVASEIRERILQLAATSEHKPIQPSLAMGSATTTDDNMDLVELLKLAEDRMYRHKLMECKSTRNSLIRSIEKMVYEKSYETEEHASRLSDISKQIGRAIGLSDYELEELNLLSVLHDIGKIGIPDHILLKNGNLTDEEWQIMKKHSEKGYNLAKATPELVNIADSILHHHERWDGTGYPAGLKGEEIPKLSRILTIIDAYDVITHARSYKLARSSDFALSEIKKCAGTQFDPELTRIFIEIMNEDHASATDSIVDQISELAEQPA